MVEIKTITNDSFEIFRLDPIVKSFPNLNEIYIVDEFKDGVPIEIKPHLDEWFILNYKFSRKEISPIEYMRQAKNYVKEHRPLFEDFAFLKSLSKITNYPGFAV